MQSSPTLVLIHGTPLGPSVWDEVTAAMRDRAVFTPDCSQVPVGPDPQAALAAQIASAIDGELDVVGHSFGGQTAIELALRIPERVRSLTILCSRDTPFPPFADLVRQMGAGELPAPESTLARWFTPGELAAAPPAVTRARDDLVTASGPDWARALAAIAGFDRSGATPTLRMPTTVVGAGRDGVSTPDAVTAMAGRIRHATLQIHEDWAHMSPFADTSALVGLLRRATDLVIGVGNYPKPLPGPWSTTTPRSPQIVRETPTSKAT